MSVFVVQLIVLVQFSHVLYADFDHLTKPVM